jgi:hypothetical protein
MMLPLQMEAVTQARLEHWEAEIRRHKLLATLPTQTPRWRRWLGHALLALGVTLMRGGAWVARLNHNEHIFAG